MSGNKPELTRDMILEVAKDLFVKHGYKEVSMRQIANELDCSHGAIYYYFKNKATLFHALIEEEYSILVRIMDHVAQSNLESKEKIKTILLEVVKFGLTNQSHYEIMFLIKVKYVRDMINKDPFHVYQTFAKRVGELCEGKLTIKKSWSMFLALHGFISFYI